MIQFNSLLTTGSIDIARPAGIFPTMTSDFALTLTQVGVPAGPAASVLPPGVALSVAAPVIADAARQILAGDGTILPDAEGYAPIDDSNALPIELLTTSTPTIIAAAPKRVALTTEQAELAVAPPAIAVPEVAEGTDVPVGEPAVADRPVGRKTARKSGAAEPVDVQPPVVPVITTITAPAAPVAVGRAVGSVAQPLIAGTIAPAEVSITTPDGQPAVAAAEPVLAGAAAKPRVPDSAAPRADQALPAAPAFPAPRDVVTAPRADPLVAAPRPAVVDHVVASAIPQPAADAKPAPVAPAPVMPAAPIAAVPVIPAAPVAPSILVAGPAPTIPTVTQTSRPDAVLSDPTIDVTATLLRPAPAPTVVTPQPAAQVFAAAMFEARESSDPVLDEPIGPAIGVGQQAPPLQATAPQAAQPVTAQPPIDPTRREWMDQMIERIETLRSNDGVRETRIRLTPDALGAVDIAITQDEHGVQVRLIADTPQARALLAEAAPRLAEMAEARGLKLANANVDPGTAGTRQEQRDPRQPGAPASTRPASAFADDDAGADSDSRIA